MSKHEVCSDILDIDSHSLMEAITLDRLRWLGHVVRIPTHRLPLRALFHVLNNTERNDAAVRLRLGVGV